MSAYNRGNGGVMAHHPTVCVPPTYGGAPYGRSAAGYTT